MYIGPVYIPAVHNFDPDTQKKNFEQIKAVNARVPIIAEFMPDARTYKAEGTLYQENGTVKTPEQYAEDILSLVKTTSAYNSILFQNRKGFVTVGDASAPLESDRPNLRTCSISGLFLPANDYQRNFHSSPVILNNDFSIALGVDGADNYIALPIGATYTGGDGSTISRTGADGAQTLVLATTANDVKFDLAADEVDVGECKVWDSVTGGDATESNWIRVFDVDHEFAGDAVFENGLIRLIVLKQAARPRLYSYYGAAWNYITQIKTGVGTQSTSNVSKITTLHADSVVLTINFIDSTLGTTVTNVITINRGEYTIDRVIDGTYHVGMETLQNTPRFAIIENTVHDGDFDGSGFTASTSTIPYALVFDEGNDHISMISSEETGCKVFTQGSAYLGATNATLAANDHFFNGVIPFSDTADLIKECELMTQGAGTAFYTGADASPKTGNTGTILNAQNENVYYEITGGTTLPLGTYKLFLRAQDANQVADDISVLVRNTTDATDVMPLTTKTLTAAFDYVSFDVTLASDDDADTIRITINKEAATANTIDLDYILWVPVTLDSGNGPQDVAHQAMVNRNLARTLALR